MLRHRQRVQPGVRRRPHPLQQYDNGHGNHLGEYISYHGYCIRLLWPRLFRQLCVPLSLRVRRRLLQLRPEMRQRHIQRDLRSCRDADAE